MEKTYMFEVVVNHGYKFTIHFTNNIGSKNDGALIVFRDENDEVHNEDPKTVTITTKLKKKYVSKKEMKKLLDQQYKYLEMIEKSKDKVLELMWNY